MNGGRESVTVRVPGSTSNCGAGFDALGLALQLYNRVTLSVGPAGAAETAAAGDGAGIFRPERPRDARAQALVADAAEAFFAATGVARVSFDFRIEGEVPAARGLGSSATIIVGVLAGLDVLRGTKLTRRRLMEIGTALEGNPENIAGGVLGGFTVSRTDPATGAYVDSVRVAVPEELGFVVVSPAMELTTKASRGVLPATLPFSDAVRSVNSAAYLAAIFATGEFDKLPRAVGDFLHEPYRLPRIPGAREAIAAGVAAGALTGWLSGSGSSVLCVTRGESGEAVGAAMRAAFERAGAAAEARVLRADNAGYTVE